MNYEETLNLLNSLGWIKVDNCNNRSYYSLANNIGQIIEHNGNWYISSKQDPYYIENPDKDIITEYSILLSLISERLDKICPSHNWKLALLALDEAKTYIKYRKWKSS